METIVGSKGFEELSKFPNEFYDIREINFNQIRECDGILNNLLNKNFDGLIVRNFLSAAECQDLVVGVSRLSKELETQTAWGCLYGQPLIGSANNMDRYFAKSKMYKTEFKRVLSYDIDQKIFQTLHRLSGGVPVDYARKDEKEYSASTTRLVRPNSGKIHPHIENEFLKELPEFMHVLSMLDKNYQMNFLIIGHQAEREGNLVLYDLTWENTPREFVEGQAFYNHESARKQVELCPNFSLTLNSGDLLLFDGGNIWHSVEDVKGSQERITMGGFMSYTKDKNKIIVYN